MHCFLQIIGLVENQSDWYIVKHGTSSWPALVSSLKGLFDIQISKFRTPANHSLFLQGCGYNTGVMLIDLKKMRTIGWSQHWKNIASIFLKNASHTSLADQVRHYSHDNDTRFTHSSHAFMLFVHYCTCEILTICTKYAHFKFLHKKKLVHIAIKFNINATLIKNTIIKCQMVMNVIFRLFVFRYLSFFIKTHYYFPIKYPNSLTIMLFTNAKYAAAHIPSTFYYNFRTSLTRLSTLTAAEFSGFLACGICSWAIMPIIRIVYTMIKETIFGNGDHSRDYYSRLSTKGLRILHWNSPSKSIFSIRTGLVSDAEILESNAAKFESPARTYP